MGLIYGEREAQRLAQSRGWSIARDGAYYRRVVASPRPKRIFELNVIELLVSQGVIVICAGGGGIPTISREDGSLIGIEAVIDKDLASPLLARELKADVFIMLTDVDAVYQDWGEPGARAFRRISVQSIHEFSFAAGTMAPKVDAAIEFVEHTGGIACIGRLQDAQAILNGDAGTVITRDAINITWWD